METGPVPLVKELLFVGGGHAHALALRMWGMNPVPGVRLTVVNPGPTAPYSGMLPGHIAGHYARDALEIDLVKLARFAGARLICDRAVALDPTAKRVTLAGGRALTYDICSLDIGITSDMPALPGFAAHGVAAKPLARFADRWAEVCAGTGPIRISVVGGGVAGCEVAMVCAHRMQTLGRAAEICVIDRGPILGGVVPAARRHLLGALAGWGITRHEGTAPAEVTASDIRLEDGRRIASDLTIGTAAAVPQAWVADTGLAVQGGFLVVDEYLRSVSDPTIYAAGDCAHFAPDPRPKAGVYAVRAAPVLAHNLRADLIGAQRRAFKPQRDFLKLISMGGQRAVAEKSGIAVAGGALWRWKNAIDQKFMDQFRQLPRMDKPLPPANAARGVSAEMVGPAPCGGCGAKLGAGALSGVLSGLPSAGRADVERVPGDDAAVLVMGKTRQVISTDHLRAFALDPALVSRVAAIHALGDVWAMGAVPQSALATVILPRMATQMQGAWLDEVMAAAAEVFAAEGAEVVGGHSSMGTELTVGFTVTGLLNGPTLTLRGARPGDALILTKPLGTGVILAAEMQAKAPGDQVMAAWQAMARPQGDASALLAPLARAMTDVTGFGLVGHLSNICTASGVGARVDLAALPLLDGAEALAVHGLRSTLYPQNRATLRWMVTAPDTARADLCFDPQTAGGLLAALPEADAQRVLPQIRALGHDAAIIGTVTEAAGITLI
ncbi:NADH dehydrogenase-like protein / Selenide,water dikinase [Roseibacterium elongatum DSM 19469]|uniref:NADH dehydrogenase-like protein / Selenide,water dikinase n=1 Tax=Roseicyclus elongatus DSM 19469 TaxID=1294273 RepID=W8RSH7_9RHOB|nr:selenide, water dikinase SelD [Roseibacterium elongatum]AHM04144.1 NADH dehydrogenase-like protein / Selenide,water dikinase [Roseibacterium elongatum DSM 19469]